MNKKVLVIEDEPLILRTLKVFLEKKGANVMTTSSGKDAITLIKEYEYDTIICDLMLNDITGFDVIEESKQKLSPDQISKKFVIITAYSSEQILQRAKQYGCKIYSKPLDLGRVIDEIV